MKNDKGGQRETLFRRVLRIYRKMFPIWCGIMGVLLFILIFLRKNNNTFTDFLSSDFSVITTVISSMFCIVFSVLYRYILRTPTSLTLSLLGLPHSGKTVYVTVLLHELLIKDEKLPGFSPYGEGTVERVQSDYALLQNSQWLPPTDIIGSNVFYYRATVNSDGTLKPKYKLEIADYAGEFLKKELVENEGYLHRTRYFKYVMDSDIIFPTIDLERYATEGREYIIEIEKTLIAALDIIKQNKMSVGKCKVPVGILFLKADYLATVIKSTAEITNEFKNLITYARGHFRNYKVFFVSAISFAPLGDKWGENIEPVNVVEPIVWALRVVRR